MSIIRPEWLKAQTNLPCPRPPEYCLVLTTPYHADNDTVIRRLGVEQNVDMWVNSSTDEKLFVTVLTWDVHAITKLLTRNVLLGGRISDLRVINYSEPDACPGAPRKMAKIDDRRVDVLPPLKTMGTSVNI